MGALKAGYQVTPELALVRRLGAGGMGTVWVAHHSKLGCEVVVKFLSESFASEPEACARFSREVAATVQVRSPHVVQTLDHGITESGVPYIVMELLEGEDLAKVLKREKALKPDEVRHIVDGVAAALSKAHERGIVHRDVKPGNVFMCAGGARPFVKLVDFGIAKRLEDETMTATDAFLGTPAYMSPEQMNGSKEIDHRADVWSLGVLAYHALTGRPPFRGGHPASIAHAVLNEPLPSATAENPALPVAIDAWVARALARDPAHRFASARQLADELASALGDLSVGSGAPIASQPVSAASARSIEGGGSTLLSSAGTQSPHVRGWAAIGAVTVLAVAAAFLVGYQLRVRAPSQSGPSSAVPLPGPPLAASTGAAAPPTPTSDPAAVSSGAAPPSSSPIGTSTATTTTARGRHAPRATPPGKRNPRAGEDDVGF